MSSTKQKIVDAAVRLFNEHGWVNVSVRDIAKELGISPGNLTYHYPNKGSVIQTIHQRIIEKRAMIFGNLSLDASIVNVNQQFQPLLELYAEYRFFFLDLLEIMRAFPDIAKMHREHIEFLITSVKGVIDYSVHSGNLHPEPKEGYYLNLSETVWILVSFWLNQQTIRGRAELNYEGARETMWNLVLPHLTEKGKQNYEEAMLALKES